MLTAYRYELYPTAKQTLQINKTIGCTRFIYNHFLEKRNEVYRTTKRHYLITHARNY